MSALAEEDLEAIYRYTEKTHGLDQLDTYADLIEDAIDGVARDPFLPGSKSRDDLLQGCRFFRVGHHFLVYRERNGVVEIGRVLHESMNFEEWLDEQVFKP